MLFYFFISKGLEGGVFSGHISRPHYKLAVEKLWRGIKCVGRVSQRVCCLKQVGKRVRTHVLLPSSIEESEEES